MVLSLIFRIVRVASASLAAVYFGSALAIAALTRIPLAAGLRPDAAAFVLFIAIVVLGFEFADCWRRKET
jgi:hypothetical protein